MCLRQNNIHISIKNESWRQALPIDMLVINQDALDIVKNQNLKKVGRPGFSHTWLQLSTKLEFIEFINSEVKSLLPIQIPFFYKTLLRLCFLF